MLDSLRFGELDSERTRYLLDQVVAGIGHYGNSIGVPTVGGEIAFEAPYEQNCLVNAMCVGLAPAGSMVRSAAAGPGNKLMLLGASTGRDGIGGASVLASAELEAGDEKRPTVQIGDPFEESKLVECCLELLDRDLLVALQDLGAAGLTSAGGEMAAKGGVGIEVDVSTVPLRNPDLEPFEVMVSESQERMLAVVTPERVEAAREVCERWQTGAAVIGEVTEEQTVRVLDSGTPVAEVPVGALVDECPLYDLAPAEPEGWMYGNEGTLDGGESGSEVLEALLATPTIASKRWAFEQYDSVVGSRTVRRPGDADAAVLSIGEAGVAIAVAIDGNGRRVACDPYFGTVEAVLECAQNLACAGAEPLGLTNCLNFGNPEKRHVAWQLDRAVSGLAEACEALGIPVVGGNVSLYNETESGPIYPTPVVGIVGELPDPARIGGVALDDGHAIALVGPPCGSLQGSELAKQRGGLEPGLPEVDLDRVASTLAFVRDAVRAGSLSVAHDVSDGGLACTLAECAIAGEVGLEVEVAVAGDPEDVLFGEGVGRFVVAGPGDAVARIVAEAAEGGVEAGVIGRAGGDVISIVVGETAIELPLDRAVRAWRSLGDRAAAPA